jgi:hypothetical protein
MQEVSLVEIPSHQCTVPTAGLLDACLQEVPSVVLEQDATQTASTAPEVEEPSRAAQALSEEAKRFLRDQLAVEQTQRTQALVDAAWQSLE